MRRARAERVSADEIAAPFARTPEEPTEPDERASDTYAVSRARFRDLARELYEAH